VKQARPLSWIFFVAYASFVVTSLILGFDKGRQTGANFILFAREMVFVLPPAFVLIGLFEVWVPRSLIERHMGGGSGAVAYFWSFLLAGTTVGGLYVAFPVAWALRTKGARLGVVFAYVSLSGVCRVPMTLFEMSFLGVEFTLIRYLAAVPLVILFSDRLGKYLEKDSYELKHPGHS
jgi:uncharacterized membrane protein YraQ (UPF0718 family)